MDGGKNIRDTLLFTSNSEMDIKGLLKSLSLEIFNNYP